MIYDALQRITKAGSMPSKDLATRNANVGLERPAFIKANDTRGTENITSADIKPPALRIAQSTSKETKRAEAALFIPGLTEGEMFNSSSREIYGEGPIGLIIINQLGHRHVEFAPKGSGEGVLDFNVPDGDPRTEFTEGVVDGKTVRLKPKATKFYDFLVYVVPEDGRLILSTLSMKSTQLKKAVQLNTTLLQSKMPSFAHLFTASAVPEARGGNNFYGWRIDPVGYVSEEQYNAASAQYDKMVGKKIEVETEGAGDDETEAARIDPDKVPF